MSQTTASHVTDEDRILMEIKRRDFLKLFGGASGALLVGGLDDVMALPEEWLEKGKNGPRIESWQNTICGLCPSGCGLRVRLVDAIPVSVKGNPVYPVNKGGLCPLGLNALHSLYHPDRIKRPLKRTDLFCPCRGESTSGYELYTTMG